MATAPEARRSRRRWALWVGGVAAALLIAGALAWRARSQWPPRFAAVEPGVLYRSAQPTVAQLERIVAAHHVRCLAIVREGDSDRVRAEKQFARAHGLKVVHIPITSRARIRPEWISAFFDALDDPANRPLLVHCSAGRHRTGYLCALYRVERQHWTPEAARRELLSYGFDAESQSVVLAQFDEYAAARRPTVARTDAAAGDVRLGRATPR